MRILSGLAVAAVAVAACFGVTSIAAQAADPAAEKRVADRKLEFAVFQHHCTSCHNSVADPERPGKTRDEWYRIVALMQGHGLIITPDETDMIVDLLYTLRPGMEDNPG